MSLAFVRCFHEREKFDGFFRGDGSDAGPEEFDDFGDKRMITIVSANFTLALFAPGSAPVGFRVFAIDADASTVPRAGHLNQPVAGRAALHALAPRAHDREKRFDAVNAIPEKIGRRLFQVAGTPGFRDQHVADGTIPDGLCVFAETERRGAE